MTRIERSEADDPAGMRFFEGFAWAVPTAFAGALAAFRFEQGDVLFRARDAYHPQSGPPGHAREALQVLHPPRSARVTPSEFEGDRRSANWASEVRLELVDLETGRAEAREISQGKLLMALWQGDDRWLDPQSDEPPMLFGARELASRLDQSSAAFASRFETQKGCSFLFAVDQASDSSRVKARSIEDALGTVGALERIDLTPEEAGIAEAVRFHPALAIRGLAVAKATPAACEAALRRVLYGGASPTPEADEETTDRFSVARHGLLAPLSS